MGGANIQNDDHNNKNDAILGNNNNKDDTILGCLGKPPTSLKNGKEVPFDYWAYYDNVISTRCNQSKQKPSDNPFDSPIFLTEMGYLEKLYTTLNEYGPCMFCEYKRVPLGLRYDLPFNKTVNCCKVCNIKIAIVKRFIYARKNSNGDYSWGFMETEEEADESLTCDECGADIVYSLRYDKIEFYSYRKKSEDILCQDGFLVKKSHREDYDDAFQEDKYDAQDIFKEDKHDARSSDNNNLSKYVL